MVETIIALVMNATLTCMYPLPVGTLAYPAYVARDEAGEMTQVTIFGQEGRGEHWTARYEGPQTELCLDIPTAEKLFIE